MRTEDKASVEFTLPSGTKPDAFLAQRSSKKIIVVSVALVLFVVATCLF